MKNKGIKELLIVELISNGMDFNLSPFQISDSQAGMLAEYAKQVGYREPKDGYFCRGRAFFCHLQKIYKADRLLQSDLENL